MEREVSVKAKEAERRVISPSAEDNSIINSPPPQRKPQANQEPPSGSVKTFNKFLTSGDLEASFYEKLSSEASFWYIHIYIFFQICDLGWPLVTSRILFLKNWGQARHFYIYFTYFR